MVNLLYNGQRRQIKKFALLPIQNRPISYVPALSTAHSDTQQRLAFVVTHMNVGVMMLTCFIKHADEHSLETR